MDNPNLDILNSFTETSLPDLDVVVLGALEIFAAAPPPSFPKIPYKRPLVVGSGGAAAASRILFDDTDAVFADESTYEARLAAVPSIDGAVIVSASGGKHAVPTAENLTKRKIPVMLWTNNPEAPAKQFLPGDAVFVFPKNREPYTYNTSTYLSMILAKTEEDPTAIHRFLTESVAPAILGDLSHFDAFFIVTPPRFDALRTLFSIKFDELFGAKVSARAFSTEQAKHAKTVVPSERECFLSLGAPQSTFGEPSQRLSIPIPQNAGAGAVMAVGYFVIGHIQRQHPPYFKDHIANYVQKASKVFGHEISVVVE